MKPLVKRLITPLLTLAVLFYLMPIVGHLDQRFGFLLILLLTAINPLAVFYACLVDGKRQGFKWVLPVLSVVLFLPTVFIFYNASALGYTIFYVIAGFAGEFFGHLIHKKNMRDQIEY